MSSETTMRIQKHPILGDAEWANKINLIVDGIHVEAADGEPIAVALIANGWRIFRHTARLNEPRGLFCALGRCTDCVMTVDGQPNVRTCVTPARDGMVVESQVGLGKWSCLEAWKDIKG